MMFVRATGPLEKLNEFNLKVLSAENYHPENASEYLSGAEGYRAESSICPFDGSIRQIEEITEGSGVDFTTSSESMFVDDSRLTEQNLNKLTKYVSENDFESSDINTFLSGLKPKIDEYGKAYEFYNEKKNQLLQRIDKLKHFEALDVDPKELMGTSYIDVHFGSLPKDSMIKLYMYNDDNKFIFNTYSSDEKYFWGVYCAPKQDAEEAAKIMSALYFDELIIDPSEGSVPEVIKKCRDELESVSAKLKEINDFWEANSAELKKDYLILLDLQTVWSFRKYAAVKALDDSFCCIGWIPKKDEKRFRKLLSSVEEIEFTVKDPEKSVTASGVTEANPFERPIRDIEHLSHQVRFELTPNKLHSCIGSSRALTKDYIKKLTRYLGGGDINSDDNGTSGLNGKIHAMSLKRKELKAREKYLRKKVKRLSRFKSLDVDISDLKNVSYMVVRFGVMPVKYAEEAAKHAEKTGYVFNICSSDDKSAWCIYVAPKKQAASIDELFESYYFREYKIDDNSGLIPDLVEKYKAELNEIDAEYGKISEFWKENEDEIIDCYSILQDLQQLWNARKYISEKNGKYVYSGTASSRDKKKILTLYDAIGGFSDEGKPEAAESDSPGLTPPTKLSNIKLFSPYEYYVKMYGMPGYHSIDITGFVAITYTLLFGIMFGDLGQGFVLALGGFLAWKLKKMELGKILVPCGISSMFFGLIFGSFFGFEEFLDPLYHAVGMKGKPLSVMDSINTVLLFAISIGIALVSVSICINIYTNIRAKKIGAALFDNNGLAGLLLYLCCVNLVYKFMGGEMIIPSLVCMIVIPICVVILFLKEILIGIVDKHDNWKPDSVADFLMQNVFEMLEYMLSYFSNTVSFLRVGAFVLVHAGMMMVVFSLAGENENIFVIILGNILVIALEGLLTGIQALRLEFYEMFSRCFEGDGKPFISARELLADINKK